MTDVTSSDPNDLVEAVRDAATRSELDISQLEAIAAALPLAVIGTLARSFDSDPHLTWRQAAACFTDTPNLRQLMPVGSGTALHRAYADAVLRARIEHDLATADADIDDLPELPIVPTGTQPHPLWGRWRVVAEHLPAGSRTLAELERRLSAHRTQAHRRLLDQGAEVCALSDGTLVIVIDGHTERRWQWRNLTCDEPTPEQRHLAEQLPSLLTQWTAPS